ncbi:MAG TPA: methyltransferase domain-containing protein [Steroidobacter sp.]|uniref:methyltransferase domain-containing protein n=1 Tax=Steroidobacter sp. TaxID=1978227 RepID=UPI002ED7AE4F
MPKRVAELGPGDSIGAGIAALLCGAETYYGLDALPLANLARNIAVLDGLVELFKRRAPISASASDPPLPTELIQFDEGRIPQIRESILNPTAEHSLIRYVAPWWSSDQIERGSIDLIFSTAVLEHVEDLPHTYRAMREWLGPGGWTSHQIDYRCHGIAPEWNEHWTYPDWLWRLVKGRRSFFLNRRPHSTHLKLHSDSGFRVIVDRRQQGPALARNRLAKPFRNLTDFDLTTLGALIQAQTS